MWHETGRDPYYLIRSLTSTTDSKGLALNHEGTYLKGYRIIIISWQVLPPTQELVIPLNSPHPHSAQHVAPRRRQQMVTEHVISDILGYWALLLGFTVNPSSRYCTTL